MGKVNRARESHSRFSEDKEEKRGVSVANVLALATKWHPHTQSDETIGGPSGSSSKKKKGFEGEVVNGNVEDTVLTFSNCIHCNTPITKGYIGRWGNSGTCSRDCEIAQEAKPRDFGEPSKRNP